MEKSQQGSSSKKPYVPTLAIANAERTARRINRMRVSLYMRKGRMEKERMRILNEALHNEIVDQPKVAELIEDHIKKEYQRKMEKFEDDVSTIYTSKIEEYGHNIGKFFEAKIKILEEEIRRVREEKFKLEKKENEIIKCPLCLCHNNSPEEFASHFSMQHRSKRFMPMIHHLNSMVDFHVWKEYKERDNFTKLIKVVEEKKEESYSEGDKCYFICVNMWGSHMSHFSSKTKVDEVKDIISTQIKNWCPAFMEAKIIGDGKVEVNYCFNHIGHPETEILKKIDKIKIKILMELSLTDQEILNCLSFVDPSNRLFYTDKNDLSSVREDFPLIKPQESIFTPLCSRISEKRESDGVRVFNPPIRHNGLDLCVVIINNNHLEAMRNFSNRGIFVEKVSTDLELELVSICILDEMRGCTPAAFMFSDKYDMRLLFYHIKKLYEEFNPKYLISHDDDVWNAFLDIFPGKETMKIPCSHVEPEEVKHSNVSKYTKRFQGRVFDRLTSLLAGDYHATQEPIDEFVSYCSQYYKCNGTRYDKISFGNVIEMIFDRNDDICEDVPVVKMEEEEEEEGDSKAGIVEWQKLISELSSYNFVPSEASRRMLTKMMNVLEEYKCHESII